MVSGTKLKWGWSFATENPTPRQQEPAQRAGSSKVREDPKIWPCLQSLATHQEWGLGWRPQL